jgi:hypothetical protein
VLAGLRIYSHATRCSKKDEDGVKIFCRTFCLCFGRKVPQHAPPSEVIRLNSLRHFLRQGISSFVLLTSRIRVLARSGSEPYRCSFDYGFYGNNKHLKSNEESEPVCRHFPRSRVNRDDIIVWQRRYGFNLVYSFFGTGPSGECRGWSWAAGLRPGNCLFMTT